MKKEKFQQEYMLNSASREIVWTNISTAAGLERWFADGVKVEGKIYTFEWGGGEERRLAEVTAIRSGVSIRFRWVDEKAERTYFEFKIGYDELTGDCMLTITDFAEPDEKSEQIDLWDSEVEELKRACGV